MADRKNQILAATCTVIGRSGAHDLRVEDVAKEADVSPALVYYYFDTRAELLSRAFDFADERSGDLSDEHLRADLPARKRLADYLTGEFDDTPEVRENWVIWSEMDAIAIFDQQVRTAVQLRSRNWVSIVTTLIEDGVRDRSISDTIVASDSAERLTSLVDSIGQRIEHGSLELERGRTLLLDGIERELGPQP